MSTHDTVYAALAVAGVTALVSTRIYRYHAPENATAPYITFEIISEVNHNLLNGGPVGRQMRVQVNCFAVSATAAEALGDAVEAALRSTGYIVMRQTFWDAETKLFWTLLDWSTRLAAA